MLVRAVVCFLEKQRHSNGSDPENLHLTGVTPSWKPGNLRERLGKSTETDISGRGSGQPPLHKRVCREAAQPALITCCHAQPWYPVDVHPGERTGHASP